MNFLKTVARKIVFPAITATGLERILSSFSTRQTVILMYHGVVPEANHLLSVNHIGLETFGRHLEYIRKRFSVIPLQEAFSNFRQGIHPEKKSVVLTFDDGYENNYTYAYPLLKNAGLPATLFVTAQCLSDPEMLLWYDTLDLCCDLIDYAGLKGGIRLPGRENGESMQEITGLSGLRKMLKSLNRESKQQLLSGLIDREKAVKRISTISPDYYRLLRKSQIREMADSGLIEIGSHTMYHPNLDVLNEGELAFELSSSKKLLEDATGKKVSSLAFPDGAYNEQVKQKAVTSGYENLLAADYRLATDYSDMNIQPRFSISNTTTAESGFIQIQMAFQKSGI